MKGALDLVIRLLFFAAAPFLLVFIAAIFPVTGAVLQIAVALLGFFLGEALRALALRSKLANWALSSQLQFEAYYRAHPPRTFLYYVFYPLLFPYWLTVPDARREFLLFKGYTLTSFLFLLLSLVYGFVTAFPPELTVRDFLPIAAGTFVAEAVVVLMFLMPIVTTVVHFHTLRAKKSLGLLLVVGLASVSVAAVRLERRRDPIVSYATRARVRLRSDADPIGATAALTAALQEASKALPAAKSDVDTDGKVEGVPLEKAHDALVAFFKIDEAEAFDLWFTRQKRSTFLVVYFEARRGHQPIWLAIEQSKTITHDEKKLPKGAFRAMNRATE